MWIARQPAADLAAEAVEVVLAEAPFEKRPRVDAGAGVALDVDVVTGPSLWPRKKWLKPTS